MPIRPPSQASFPRAARLLTGRDYRRVFDASKRVADRYFTLVVCRQDHQPARLGLAMSKKGARRAVDRNRLKRLVRERFRHRQQELTGLQIVAMARSAAVSADNATLRHSLNRLFGRAAADVGKDALAERSRR